MAAGLDSIGSSRRQARSAETRAAILAASERIFAASGLAGARIDAIAAEAGVNKALLYYYFRSKDRLFDAVVDEHFREFNDSAMKILGAPGSARAILLQYVSMHIDFMCRRQRHALFYQQVMMSGGKRLQRLVQRYFVQRSQALRRLLERGMRDGEFRRGEPFHTAISIVALIVFYFSASQVLQLLGSGDAYSPSNLRRRKREVLDFIRHGLFADPEAPLT